MANFWQPRIDKWLETVNANNTPSFPTSYQYSPAEGEEKNKVFVSGQGTLSLSELKSKISDLVNDAAAMASSDDLESIERLHHMLFSSPELSTLIKQYIDTLRAIRAKRIAR